MSEFPKFKQADYPKLYIEQTDKELAKKVDPNFRYAYFKTIAKAWHASTANKIFLKNWQQDFFTRWPYSQPAGAPHSLNCNGTVPCF